MILYKVVSILRNNSIPKLTKFQEKRWVLMVLFSSRSSQLYFTAVATSHIAHGIPSILALLLSWPFLTIRVYTQIITINGMTLVLTITSLLWFGNKKIRWSFFRKRWNIDTWATMKITVKKRRFQVAATGLEPTTT